MCLYIRERGGEREIVFFPLSAVAWWLMFHVILDTYMYWYLRE